MARTRELARVHYEDRTSGLLDQRQGSLLDRASEGLDTGDSGISYLYSGFAMLSFPYRELKRIDDVWERRNGAYTMIVEPGIVPELNGSRKYGVPFGTRARIIMCFLQTEAVKNQSRVVSLGTSMNDWMQRMGIEGGGGTNMQKVRDQTMRISACHLTVGFQTGKGENGFIHRNIVSGMIQVPPADSTTGWLLEETAELSEDFYRQLLQHPLPVEETAIRSLSGSAMAMDIYVWLAYRLHQLSRPTTIQRDALYAQFGSNFSESRQFWAKFRKPLEQALAVYPDARVEILSDGLKLFPSTSPVPKKLVKGGPLLLR